MPDAAPLAVRERRFVLGVAYPALRKDGQGEWMNTDVVEQAAWDFCATGRQIGFFHADGTVGHGTVVENYIHRGPAYTMTAPSAPKCRSTPATGCSASCSTRRRGS